MPRSAPPRARRAGQPGAGPGGSDVPFVTANEIPVRLSEFYDIFISWSHAGRRQPWHSGTLVGADGNLEQRAAPARPSGGVQQAATNGRNEMIGTWHKSALVGDRKSTRLNSSH